MTTSCYIKKPSLNMIYSPQNIKHKCCTWVCKTGLLDSLSLEACWVNRWYCVRQNKRGEVKDKEKDEPPFNYSFYRNWTVLNWFVEVFPMKTQRHKRHWVCCCTDLWWSDLYRPCASWAVVSSYLWFKYIVTALQYVSYVIITNRHIKAWKSVTKTLCTFNCSSSAEEKASIFTLICENNEKQKNICDLMETTKRLQINWTKVKTKEKKIIFCRRKEKNTLQIRF